MCGLDERLSSGVVELCVSSEFIISTGPVSVSVMVGESTSNVKLVSLNVTSR